MDTSRSGVRVRLARQEDLPAMVGLLRDLFSVEEDFAFDEARQRSGLRQMMGRSPSRRLYVAVGEDGVVGMCSAQVVNSTAMGGPAALIEDVVVRQDRRGRGIGRQLMDAVERWARRRGIERLQLLADRTNLPALGFYRALGWQETRMICLRRNLDGPDASA